MTSISVVADFKSVQKALTAIEKKVIPSASVTALNKTMAAHKIKLKRIIAFSNNVGQKLIEKKIKVYKASTKFRAALLWMNTSAIPVSRIGVPRVLKKGGVKVGRGRYFPNAFVFKSKFSHRDEAFVRGGGKLETVKIVIEPTAERTMRRLQAITHRTFMKFLVPEVERKLARLRNK